MDRAGAARLRLFCRPLPAPGEATLPTATAHHARVLRLPIGTALRLFDGMGQECDAEWLDADRALCRVEVAEVVAARARRVTLVIALPKGKKLDTIIRMVTELGVHAVWLVITQRTVARPDRDAAEHRVDRLQRIAEEACAQSQQSRVPTIHGPAPLLQVCALAPGEAWKLVPWEESSTSLDAAVYAQGDVLPDDAWLVIGPEGGLAAQEIEALGDLGYVHATLGPTVLRVDTAAVVAVSALLDRIGLLCR